MYKKKIKRNYTKKYLAIIASILLFLVLIIDIPFKNKVYPNTYLSGIYLGDKTKTEAIQLFENTYKIPDKITLNIDGVKSDILTSEIVSEIKYKDSIERAYNYANSGNYVKDIITKLQLILKPVEVTPIVVFNNENLLESLLIASESIGKKPIYPSAQIIDGVVKIDPGKNGIDIDIEKTKEDIKKVISSNITNKEVNIKPRVIEVALTGNEIQTYKVNAEKLINKKIALLFESETLIISNDELISFLTPNGFSDEKIKLKILEISRQLNRSPQDSVFIIEDGKVVEFSPSKDGIIVDETSLLQQIKNLPETINIPVIKTSPKIKNEDVNDLGIDSLLGTGNSNFRGSIPNRIYNVNLAQSKFKGVLIPPNEVVSFNNILGDVSGLTGYKAAYVIKDGKTVLGDGGGVCQVSTTLFRAVLDAGLPVIERKAHAYRVGYYEQGYAPGLDATVYSPTTDFKFQNDTPNYLLIQPTINLQDLSLKFEIYGTDDGRVSTVTKPVINSSIAPAEDLYVDDPTLPAGQIKQIEHKAYGAKVTFKYTVVRNGETLIDKVFVSNYRPWQAVYLKGTKI